MTAQTFVASAYDIWYVTGDYDSDVHQGVHEFTVPACSSSAGDTLVMYLHKHTHLFQEVGNSFGLNAPSGWNSGGGSIIGSTATGDEVRVWTKQSDGAQGSVLLEWPHGSYKSSAVVFGAMLAYSTADGYVNIENPPSGYEWVGTQQVKWNPNPRNGDMSLPTYATLCTLDQTLSYCLIAIHGGKLGLAPASDMTGAIVLGSGINERIRVTTPVPPWPGEVLPEPREIVIGDEFDVDLDFPARTITQVTDPTDVYWVSRRQSIYGIPFVDCLRSAYWGTKVVKQ